MYIIILYYNNCVTNSFFKEPPMLLNYFPKTAFNIFGKDKEICLSNI